MIWRTKLYFLLYFKISHNQKIKCDTCQTNLGTYDFERAFLDFQQASQKWDIILPKLPPCNWAKNQNTEGSSLEIWHTLCTVETQTHKGSKGSHPKEIFWVGGTHSDGEVGWMAPQETWAVHNVRRPAGLSIWVGAFESQDVPCGLWYLLPLVGLTSAIFLLKCKLPIVSILFGFVNASDFRGYCLSDDLRTIRFCCTLLVETPKRQTIKEKLKSYIMALNLFVDLFILLQLA